MAADPMEETLLIVARSSNRDPKVIRGSWNLGTPAPIGMDSTLINGMIPALNEVIAEHKSSKTITVAEMKKTATVAALLELVSKKIGT